MAKPENPKANISRILYDAMNLVLSTKGTKSAPGSYLTGWKVIWGDGLEYSGNGNPPSTITHEYDEDGTYGITFTVYDRNGRNDSMPGAFIIRGNAPVVPALNITCPPNQSSNSVDGNPVVVNYPPATASGGTPPYNFNYDHPSGSSFPVGLTTVNVSVTDSSTPQKNASCSFNVNVTHTSLAVLTQADLSVAGVFLTPDINSGGGYTVNYPVAMKVVGSTRIYWILDGGGNISEFNEPAVLSPPGTPLASIVQAPGTIAWGPFPAVTNSANAIPATPSVFAWGLNYDPVTGYLFLNWSGAYSGLPFGLNSIAAASFGASSLVGVGNWTINQRSGTVGMPMSASGVINIPSWFTAAYLPAGQRLGVGLGGAYGSISLANSYGPSIEAIPMPAGNPMTPGVDVELPPGTVLLRYFNNPTGPSCAGHGIGCVPPVAPTNPNPAQMAFNKYSMDQFNDDWDPYAGHGWWNSDAGGVGNWYDDGVKTGIIYSMSSPSGWINTTISASPAPTISGTGTAGDPYIVNFTVPTIDFNDGTNIQVGDALWIQTCTPIGSSGCELDNLRYVSQVEVIAINTSTNRITAVITSVDFGSGTHLPVVGGIVWGGVIYAHATPQPSRVTFLMQIYSPFTLTPVVGGNTYDPIYNSEFTLSGPGGMVNYFGYPGGASPGVKFPGSLPTNVLVDNVNKKIILVYRYGKTNIGTNANLMVVLNVS